VASDSTTATFSLPTNSHFTASKHPTLGYQVYHLPGRRHPTHQPRILTGRMPSRPSCPLGQGDILLVNRTSSSPSEKLGRWGRTYTSQSLNQPIKKLSNTIKSNMTKPLDIPQHSSRLLKRPKRLANENSQSRKATHETYTLQFKRNKKAYFPPLAPRPST